jgi:predicted membrane channel-forming protein YqfA (hemolysin III family)
MTPHAVDIICLLVAALVPIPLILRWNRLGLALGTIVIWGSLAVAGILLSALDPRREADMLDAVWLLFGWLGGLVYCLPIYLIKRFVLWLWRGAASPARAADA